MTARERQLMVREFCKHMGWHMPDVPEIPQMGLIDQFLFKLREEVDELCVAAGQAGDPMSFTKLLDALCDVEYLLHGVALLFGVQNALDDAFYEVHASNMTKTLEHGVVTKPHWFRKPDMVAVLKRHFPKQGLLFRS